MVDVEQLYRFIQYIIKKESTGHLAPAEYNRLLPRALDDFFTQRYGLPERYQPGSPLPSIGYELTQKISDDLRPLKEELETHSVDAQGKATIPDNYVHVASLTYMSVTNKDCKNPEVCPRPIEVFDEDKFWQRVCHPNKKPTKKRPIAAFFADHIKIYPQDIDSIKFVYLRYPATPTRAYSSVNDDDVYDAATSVQIELPAITFNVLARILLSYIGINLREEMLLSYAETIKEKGV